MPKLVYAYIEVNISVQRITNCILLDKERDQVLLLKKPRRGWWVAPGGKMEQGETILEAVVREYREETGLTLLNPELRGVFTIIVEEDEQVQDEWMMFTFFCTQFSGNLLDESAEGELEWIPVGDVFRLPKAKGDEIFFEHILMNKQPDILFKTFYYTSQYDLLTHK